MGPSEQHTLVAATCKLKHNKHVTMTVAYRSKERVMGPSEQHTLVATTCTLKRNKHVTMTTAYSSKERVMGPSEQHTLVATTSKQAQQEAGQECVLSSKEASAAEGLAYSQLLSSV